VTNSDPLNLPPSLLFTYVAKALAAAVSVEVLAPADVRTVLEILETAAIGLDAEAEEGPSDGRGRKLGRFSAALSAAYVALEKELDAPEGGGI
jgi:hypothetical protein